ncbi:FecR family protein [Flammeovirga sp. EKP202]|uniref:FecR family protein n=1 Tax=Flammeovirga sp. EKP202 TaxID=2770592 RepID=UPI00165FFB5E|nr:FecR domain-containing protein [Flammeovirga sp. EKP202]MBD0402390.1 FecR family protein [Flammeovirga sp. EKP202]
MSAIDKYIENKDFVTWVLGDVSKEDYWNNYLKDNPEEKENIDKAKDWVKQVKVKDPYFSAQRERELWIEIDQKISNTKTPTKTISFKTTWWKYGAAVIVLGLIVNFYFRNFVPQHHVDTARNGFTNNITLPDGSTVDLNAGSSISYDKKSFNAGRYISLKGEAYFKVEKGQTFQVNTEMGTVTVLGTSFNILARKQQWIVSCYTGKVAVKDNEGNQVILTKGQEAEYKNGGFVTNAHAKKQPNWQKGLFKYSNAPLESVFEEIQRQFDIRIIYKNSDIQKLRFSGTISNKSLEKALDIISKSMDINYKIDNKKKEVEISY